MFHLPQAGTVQLVFNGWDDTLASKWVSCCVFKLLVFGTDSNFSTSQFFYQIDDDEARNNRRTHPMLRFRIRFDQTLQMFRTNRTLTNSSSYKRQDDATIPDTDRSDHRLHFHWNWKRKKKQSETLIILCST